MDAINKFQVSRGGNVYSFCGKSIFSSDNQKFTVVNKSGKLLFEYVSPTNQQGIMLLLSRISFAVFCFLKSENEHLGLLLLPEVILLNP